MQTLRTSCSLENIAYLIWKVLFQTKVLHQTEVSSGAQVTNCKNTLMYRDAQINTKQRYVQTYTNLKMQRITKSFETSFY